MSLSSSSAPAASSSSSADAPLDLEQSLDAIINNLYSLSVIVEDYKDDDETTRTYEAKLKDLVDAYASLDAQRDTLADGMKVPTDLVGVVDAGMNPDLYTKDMLLQVARKSEQQSGRVNALNQLKVALEAELAAADAFADEYAAVQARKQTLPKDPQ